MFMMASMRHGWRGVGGAGGKWWLSFVRRAVSFGSFFFGGLRVGGMVGVGGAEGEEVLTVGIDAEAFVAAWKALAKEAAL